MSDSDFSEELFALATEGTEKKRKRSRGQSSSKSSKRRKADVSIESDSDADQPESEEEDIRTIPYPLEGKYVDEADRQRLLGMPEVQRENILASRQEEIQKFKLQSQLDQMVRDQSGRTEDSVARSAKRQHAQRGATKEKSRKLDELKAKRRAKDEKKRTRNDSPRRERSSSPMDMETSDEEEEDGQISKLEEIEERERRLFNKTNPEDEPVTLEDINKARLTRDMLVKNYTAPWFEDYVKGAWVRYLIGAEKDTNAPVYRICEIINLGADLVKPYKINDQPMNQQLELKHGNAVKCWSMDKVSNSPFTEAEFNRLVRDCEHEKVKLPNKRQLEKKSAQLTKLVNQPKTESDITAMLARKNQLRSQLHANSQSSVALTMEKSRLSQARTLALRRQDYTEVQQIDEQLVVLVGEAPKDTEDIHDLLAKVNERNRKANQEAIRLAEREAERRRREKKLAASGTATPTGPGARLRTLNLSRQGTPSTPSLKPDGLGTPRSVSPLPPTLDTATTAITPSNAIPPLQSAKSTSSNLKTSFEASMFDSVEIDLGDF